MNFRTTIVLLVLLILAAGAVFYVRSRDTGDAPDVVDQVMSAAEAVGLGRQVNAYVSPLSEWSPDGPLTAVVCTPAAFAGLSHADRARVIEVLQSATLDGGVGLFLFGTAVKPIQQYRDIDYQPSKDFVVQVPEELAAIDQPVSVCHQ